MDLEKELQAAQGLLVQAELLDRLQRNLALFQALMPEAYTRFASHRPGQIQLRLGEDGEPILVNAHLDDAPVYQGSPRAYAALQVARYRQDPRHFRTHPRTSVILDEENNAHISNANRMIRLLQEHPREDLTSLPASVDFMLMLGIGLGYQVEELLREHDVRHLCVVEPEADIFFASLHTLEWAPLLEHFSQPGHSLELIVGEDEERCYHQLEEYLWWIGGYHVFRPFIFEHLVSGKLAASYAGFFERLMPKMTGQLGYFDDERFGLAHTVANGAAGVPVLSRHAGRTGPALDKPAFIVANGPSLDEALDTLRQLRDRVVLFSCGTALGSLRKAGIKPDFHVEMERSRPVVEWLSGSTDPEFREGITLLALNTVHPEVFGLFGQAGMALKPNDLGTAFLQDHAREGALPLLDWCNPTVANAALSFAAALGFRDVTLFGLDLGFPKGGQHHSALSAHYDVKKDEQHTLGTYRHDDANNLVEPGNFGGDVVTTPTYRNARIALEQVIAGTPGIRCRNTSNGVRVNGAQPAPVGGLAVAGASFDTRAFASGLFRRTFRADVVEPVRPDEARRVFDAIGPALDAIRGVLNEPVTDPDGGMALLSRIQDVLLALGEGEGGHHRAALLRGSVTMFCLLLAQALTRYADPEACVALFREARGHFAAFLDQARLMVEGDVLAPDTRSRRLAEKWARDR